MEAETTVVGTAVGQTVAVEVGLEEGPEEGPEEGGSAVVGGAAAAIVVDARGGATERMAIRAQGW